MARKSWTARLIGLAAVLTLLTAPAPAQAQPADPTVPINCRRGTC
jgi:hypothetical protein